MQFEEKEMKRYLLDNWTKNTKDIKKEVKWYSENGKDEVFRQVCARRLKPKPTAKSHRWEGKKVF